MGGAFSLRTEEKRYLREVEKHFLRRRGHPLLISPRDWALALGWFEEGIPLSVVLSAIDAVFDSAADRPPPVRPRTLAYCARAVEAMWHERRERTLAPEQPAGEAEDGRRLAQLLEEASGRLGDAARVLEAAAGAFAAHRRTLEETAQWLREGRTSVAEAEAVIAKTDGEIGRVLVDVCGQEERAEAIRQSEERLTPHRPHMKPAAWKRTLDRAVENRLRESHGLPRLSLLLL